MDNFKGTSIIYFDKMVGIRITSEPYSTVRGGIIYVDVLINRGGVKSEGTLTLDSIIKRIVSEESIVLR